MSRASVPVAESTMNPQRVLHGGVLYALADVTAYAALLGMLAPNESAVTHDLQVSVLRPAAEGSLVVFEAKVRRKGRSLAFIDVEAQVEDKLVALARVTKSIVLLR